MSQIYCQQGDVTIKRLARLLRGTFLSLLGEHEKALEDLTEVFNDPETDPKVKLIIANILSTNFYLNILSNFQVRVNALVKRATLRMQLGSPEESLHDLLMAAELGPENADVFHHRGQVFPY